MRDWPRYLRQRLDRWWWGWLRLGEPRLRDGQAYMELSVNRRDWRFRLKVWWMVLAHIRLDMTIWRWTFPVWGWWHEHRL